MIPDERLEQLWRHVMAAGSEAHLRIMYRAPIDPAEDGVRGQYRQHDGEARTIIDGDPIIELFCDVAPETANQPRFGEHSMQDTVVLAHEYGHRLSDCSGTRTAPYEAALAKYNNPDESLDEEEEELVYREEQTAWSNGRAELLELGFTDAADLAAFDRLEAEGLNNYKIRFATRRTREERRQKIARLAKSILKVDWNHETVGIAGYLTGACAALRQALYFEPKEVVDANNTVDPDYAFALKIACQSILANENPVIQPWLDGFHFHNALHRIAALADRIPLVAGGLGERDHVPDRKGFWNCNELEAICEQVNSLKHRRAGSNVAPPGGALVTVPQALVALETVVKKALELWPARQRRRSKKPMPKIAIPSEMRFARASRKDVAQAMIRLRRELGRGPTPDELRREVRRMTRSKPSRKVRSPK